MAQFKTGTAGTLYFEPGGVFFRDWIQRSMASADRHSRLQFVPQAQLLPSTLIAKVEAGGVKRNGPSTGVGWGRHSTDASGGRHPVV